MKEGWSDVPTELHIIRWKPADGREPDMYLSLDDAVDRLSLYGIYWEDAKANLLAGLKQRTPFYSLVKES